THRHAAPARHIAPDGSGRPPERPLPRPGPRSRPTRERRRLHATHAPGRRETPGRAEGRLDQGLRRARGLRRPPFATFHAIKASYGNNRVIPRPVLRSTTWVTMTQYEKWN